MKGFIQLAKVLTLTVGYIAMTACVTEVDGRQGALATDKGRQEAVNAYIELALGYVKEGQTEPAKEPLLEALKLDKNSANANAAMAYVFQIEKDPVPAEEYFKKALAAEPDNARILNNYGAFLSEQNRLPEAKQAFLKASEDSFYSGRSLVFENLGFIALEENKLVEAEDYFQRALRLNRGRVRSVLALANINYMQKDYTNALRYYNDFISAVQGRQSPQSLLLGIQLSNAMNDRVKANSYASQLEQLYPSSAEYRAYKAGRK